MWSSARLIVVSRDVGLCVVPSVIFGIATVNIHSAPQLAQLAAHGLSGCSVFRAPSSSIVQMDFLWGKKCNSGPCINFWGLKYLLENRLVEKCEFHVPRVPFLGYIIAQNQVGMDLAQVSAIAEWPVLTNPKQLQHFLGFIWTFSNVTARAPAISSLWLVPHLHCGGGKFDTGSQPSYFFATTFHFPRSDKPRRFKWTQVSENLRVCP